MEVTKCTPGRITGKRKKASFRAVAPHIQEENGKRKIDPVSLFRGGVIDNLLMLHFHAESRDSHTSLLFH
jgi:hypothetical protein